MRPRKHNWLGFPSREEVERLRSIYPPGRIVMLVEMHDEPQAPPEGTVGEIRGVDDAGSVLVRWDNGSSLSLIPAVDKFYLLKHRPEDSSKGEYGHE